MSSLRTQLDDVVANVARLNDQSAHHGGRRCFLSHTGDSDVVDIVSPPRHIYDVTVVRLQDLHQDWVIKPLLAIAKAT